MEQTGLRRGIWDLVRSVAFPDAAIARATHPQEAVRLVAALKEGGS